MPALSALTPLGQLRLSAAPSHAARFYDLQTSLWGGTLDLTPGTHAEALIYARALGYGRVRTVLDRAGDQINAAMASDELPAIERDYGLVAGANDTLTSRRAALAVGVALGRGAGRPNVESALSTLLGTAFVAYRTLRPSEAHNYPASPGAGPGVFGRVDLPPKTFRLTSALTALGAQVFAYDPMSGTDDGTRLTVGDVVSVQIENGALAEKVTITAVGGGNARTATASFARAHEAGASILTGPTPLWVSTQRHALIVVTNTASITPELRRGVHLLMARIARGISTWAIVRAVPNGTYTVAFTCATPLGTASLGFLPLP